MRMNYVLYKTLYDFSTPQYGKYSEISNESNLSLRLICRKIVTNCIY